MLYINHGVHLKFLCLLSCKDLCVHLQSREVNTFLGDIIRHMTPDRAYENYYPQLQAIVDKVLTHTRDFESLFTMVSLFLKSYSYFVIISGKNMNKEIGLLSIEMQRCPDMRKKQNRSVNKRMQTIEDVCFSVLQLSLERAFLCFMFRFSLILQNFYILKS